MYYFLSQKLHFCCSVNYTQNSFISFEELIQWINSFQPGIERSVWIFKYHCRRIPRRAENNLDHNLPVLLKSTSLEMSIAESSVVLIAPNLSFDYLIYVRVRHTHRIVISDVVIWLLFSKNFKLLTHSLHSSVTKNQVVEVSNNKNQQNHLSAFHWSMNMFVNLEHQVVFRSARRRKFQNICKSFYL